MSLQSREILFPQSIKELSIHSEELLNQSKELFVQSLDNLSIQSREELLLLSIKNFYNNNINNDIINIIIGKDKISLRILDYFVTNYCKNNIVIISDLNIYHEYKKKLKSYNKRFFDPFCRINYKNNTNKILFKFDNNTNLITSIGQLNFFKWIYQINLLTYINENYNIIINNMNLFYKNKKINKINKINNINNNINEENENKLNRNILNL